MTEKNSEIEQLRKYADDLGKIYQREKVKARELEKLNTQLKQEATKRKKAESALKESEALFKGVFQYAGMGIGLLDSRGRLNRFNDQLVKIFGYNKKSLKGKKLLDISFPEDVPIARQKMKELVLSNDNMISYDQRFLTSVKKIIWAHVNISITYVFQNEKITTVMIEDITRKKEIEDELDYLSSQILQIQEDERSRISQELHDDLSSDLFALKLKMNSLSSELPEGLQEELVDTTEYLSFLMNKVRTISHNLSPIGLESIGIDGAIRGLVERFNQRSHVFITTSLQGLDKYFTNNWDINLFRLLQEALLNALKHSKAEKIRISTRIKNGKLFVSVKDNGIGIDSGKPVQNGIGLMLMEKRARLLGGRLKVKSLKKGTEVLLEIGNKKKV